MSTLLAFDVGDRKIGVAVGTRLSPPRPLRVLAAQPAEALERELRALVAEWNPEQLVVGMPLTLEGEAQPASRRAEAFAIRLQALFERPVAQVDERYSTREARSRFAPARARGQTRQRRGRPMDAIAAAVILESYLADS